MTEPLRVLARWPVLTTTGSSCSGLLKEDERGTVYLFSLLVGQSVEIHRYDTDRYDTTVSDLFINSEPVGEEMVLSRHREVTTRYSSQCEWSNQTSFAVSQEIL